MNRKAKLSRRGYVIEQGIAMQAVMKLCGNALDTVTNFLQPAAGRILLTSMLACGLLLALPADSLRADAEPEQQGVYWRISKDGQQAGYLLGTIHSEDARVLDFSESFITELNSCEVFAMEMVPDLPTLKQLTEYMHYSETGQLQSILGQERFDRAMQALTGYQVPSDWKARMKVWAVMMTLSVPAPETGFFMDLSLSLRAAGSGLKVVGLETLEQQLQFLEQMPLDFQIQLLDHALDDYQKVDEVHEEMIRMYMKDDLHALAELSDKQLQVLDPEIRRYFTELGIDARNRHMASTALQQLADKRVFIAVGALHLPGEQGLIQWLRNAGYQLSALPLPFNREQQSAP